MILFQKSHLKLDWAFPVQLFISVCEIEYASFSPTHLHQLFYDCVPGKNPNLSIWCLSGYWASACNVSLLIKSSSFSFTFIIITKYMLDTGPTRGFLSLLVMLIAISFLFHYLMWSLWPYIYHNSRPFLPP